MAMIMSVLCLFMFNICLQILRRKLLRNAHHLK